MPQSSRLEKEGHVEHMGLLEDEAQVQVAVQGTEVGRS